MGINIRKAEAHEAAVVKDITHRTVSELYPRYYPKGAVEFFLKFHGDENIADDIKNGRTYLCIDDNGKAVGTVSVDKKHIGRLFVLPEHQGMGCGRALLDFAEKQIFTEYDEIVIDASFSAKAIYLKRGYRECEYKVVKTDNGDFLCYDIMTKKVKEK